MHRIVEERAIDGHRIVVVESQADEGTGYVLLVDGALLGDVDPLHLVPSDDEIRVFLRLNDILETE